MTFGTRAAEWWSGAGAGSGSGDVEADVIVYSNNQYAVAPTMPAKAIKSRYIRIGFRMVFGALACLRRSNSVTAMARFAASG